jgi:hypothetical protein
VARVRYFVGVGAQKAGTSWLHRQLQHHPQVAVPAWKELHYFDSVCQVRTKQHHREGQVDKLRQILSGLEDGKPDPKAVRSALATLERLELLLQPPEGYREHLDGLAGPQTVVAGEITPEYSTLTDEGFRLIRETLAPKVIFLMRDPVARYWSAVRMLARTRPRIDPEAEFKKAILRDGMWARSDYATTLDLLDEFFDPDDVLCLFYENLFTEESLRRVAAFLDVDEQWPWRLDEKVLVGESRPMPPVPEVVTERLAPVYGAVRERFGDAVPTAWLA